ncbi:hypothetical protein CFN78_03035 [Amycolatopsis antarctica]|uniref:DUF418 domain-containing protein n=1 Tax=Amycolatopsis antarctica TaxID=1854586 RepID=A0A263D9L1_9PSEU|nr:hypothetical protein [Amycolatopsis antarctica]OZM75153.1 hypothetical protein CFN78_03035 [Amycolatopsis antarctica]
MSGVAVGQERPVLTGDVTTKPTRLSGVDVARGVAVLGMYASHLGPNPLEGWLGTAFLPFEGRSAALFAVLAGVSIALMSGGREPRSGIDRTRVSMRLALRAPFLLAFGLALTWLDTSYLVILAYYGACFVLVIPFLRLGVRGLAGLAVGTAIAFPLTSFWIRAEIAPRDLLLLWPDIRPEMFADGTGLDGFLLALLVTGTFPALNLMTYIFAGMAIGRLDLTSSPVCRRLLAGGAALAALAYTASWAATDLLGGREAIEATLAGQAAAAGMSPAEYFTTHAMSIHGTPPTTTLAYELVATPHSYTPFDFLGCIGVAAAVIGGCQLLAARLPRATRPLADLGSVILSAYVLHFVAIWIIWRDDPSFGVGNFLWFAVAALVAAVLWKRWASRGPFEGFLHVVSTWPTRALLGSRR